MFRDDGFEESWKWPSELGSGFMSMSCLRPGLMLGIDEHQLYEEVSIPFGLKNPPVVIAFSMAVNLQAAACGAVAARGRQQLDFD